MNITIREQQAVKAYKVIFELKSQTMPIKSAYGLCMLKNNLEPIFSFHLEQEQSMVEECNGSIQENGTVLFPNSDKQKEFALKQKELNENEIDVSFDPVVLPDNIELSIDDVEALYPFVEIAMTFTKEE